MATMWDANFCVWRQDLDRVKLGNNRVTEIRKLCK